MYEYMYACVVSTPTTMLGGINGVAHTWPPDVHNAELRSGAIDPYHPEMDNCECVRLHNHCRHLRVGPVCPITILAPHCYAPLLLRTLGSTAHISQWTWDKGLDRGHDTQKCDEIKNERT